MTLGHLLLVAALVGLLADIAYQSSRYRRAGRALRAMQRDRQVGR